MALALTDARETRQRCRAIVEPALNDTDHSVRDVAIDAMAELADRDLFARLARFVSASDGFRYKSAREKDLNLARLSMRAVKALSTRGYHPAPARIDAALQSPSPSVVELALGTLAEMALRGDPSAIGPIASAIRGPRHRTASRLCARLWHEAPAQVAERAVDALAPLIGGEGDSSLTAEQAQVAAGNPRARSALVSRLSCGEWRRAFSAAHALADAGAGAHHLVAAVETLLVEQTAGEPRRVGLCAAAVVLARHGVPAAMDRVRAVAEHDEWEIRIEGAEALCALGEVGRGRAVLSAALRAPASAAQCESAAALVRRSAAGDEEAPSTWRGRLQELASRPAELEMMRMALVRAMCDTPSTRHLAELANLLACGSRRLGLAAAVATVRCLRISGTLPEPEPLVFAIDPYVES